MAILVAGGGGYIGSHVCKQLRNSGFEVIVYDNLSHGYREFAKWGEFVEGDIGDAERLTYVFKNFDIEAVMHFCAFIEVGESVKYPEIYYINNLKNTITLLQGMRMFDVNKFIFSSTAAVYGIPEQVPIPETEKLLPINPYGRTKLMVERILEDYHDAYGLKSIRFRYFNAAGADPETEVGEAHRPESHLIPLILDAAIGKRDNIKIFGTDYDTRDGTCIRDYVHVYDLAEAHIIGLKYLLDGGESEVFNLGSGEGYSVREVIDTVKRITGKDFPVEETGRRNGDPEKLIAQSDKVQSILGWKKQFGLDEMVSTAWDWHRKYQDMELK